jgi:hypothetical protein
MGTRGSRLGNATPPSKASWPVRRGWPRHAPGASGEAACPLGPSSGSGSVTEAWARPSRVARSGGPLRPGVAGHLMATPPRQVGEPAGCHDTRHPRRPEALETPPAPHQQG